MSGFQNVKSLFYCRPGLSQGVLGHILFFILNRGREPCYTEGVAMATFSTVSGTQQAFRKC